MDHWWWLGVLLKSVCTSITEGISGLTERGRGDSLEIGRDPWQLLPRNVFSVWIWNICPVSIEQTKQTLQYTVFKGGWSWMSLVTKGRSFKSVLSELKKWQRMYLIISNLPEVFTVGKVASRPVSCGRGKECPPHLACWSRWSSPTYIN